MSEDYDELFKLWDKSAAENAEEYEQLYNNLKIKICYLLIFNQK